MFAFYNILQVHIYIKPKFCLKCKKRHMVNSTLYKLYTFKIWVIFIYHFFVFFFNNWILESHFSSIIRILGLSIAWACGCVLGARCPRKPVNKQTLVETLWLHNLQVNKACKSQRAFLEKLLFLLFCKLFLQIC